MGSCASCGRGPRIPRCEVAVVSLLQQSAMGVRDRRLRAQGLRPIQFWVPDVRSREFAAEARQQALAVAAVDRSADDQDFIEAVSVDWGEE